MDVSQSGPKTVIPYPVQRQRIVSGVIIGVTGVVTVVAVIMHYCGKYSERKGFTAQKFFAATAQFLAVVGMALMAAWNTNNGADGSLSTSFAGVPQWRQNMGWHFIFALCFFLFLTWGEVIYDLFVPVVSAPIQVLCQLVCLGSLVTMLRAAVIYKFEYNFPQLVTIHSWTGVILIIVFAFNFVIGLLSFCVPSIAGANLKSTRNVLASICLGLTVVAIISGIMNYLPHTSCYYVPPSTSASAVDINPSEHYDVIPDGCKYANGIGVCVILSGVLSGAAFHMRANVSSPEKKDEDHNENPQPEQRI